MIAFTLSASGATSAMATVVSTSNGRLAGQAERERQRASGGLHVAFDGLEIELRLARGGAGLEHVRDVASPTRRRSSAATRLVPASSTVVRWAREARFARYWK